MTLLLPDLNLYRRLSRDAIFYKDLLELLSTPRASFSSLDPPGDFPGQSEKNWALSALEYQDKRILDIMTKVEKSRESQHDLVLFLMKLPGIPQDLSILQPLTRFYKVLHSYLGYAKDWVSQSSTKTLKANLEDIYMQLHEIYSGIHPGM